MKQRLRKKVFDAISHNSASITGPQTNTNNTNRHNRSSNPSSVSEMSQLPSLAENHQHELDLVGVDHAHIVDLGRRYGPISSEETPEQSTSIKSSLFRSIQIHP
jgi:hypothetical protein